MPEFWLIAVALASPIAGIIGFFIQLRTLKKARLENEKLRLEIDQLRQAQKSSESIVRVATHDETVKYSEARFRLGPLTDSETAEFDIDPHSRKTIRGAIVQFTVWFAVGLFVIYLAYDVFRVGRWLWMLA